jgi:hypothetical protein
MDDCSGPNLYSGMVGKGEVMKNCPLRIDEDECEYCHWHFGRDQCSVFSIATDLSVVSEEIVKQTKLLNQILNNMNSSSNSTEEAT